DRPTPALRILPQRAPGQSAGTEVRDAGRPRRQGPAALPGPRRSVRQAAQDRAADHRSEGRRRQAEGSTAGGARRITLAYQCGGARPPPLLTGGSVINVPPWPSADRLKLAAVYCPISVRFAVCVPSLTDRVPLSRPDA